MSQCRSGDMSQRPVVQYRNELARTEFKADDSSFECDQGTFLERDFIDGSVSPEACQLL